MKAIIIETLLSGKCGSLDPKGLAIVLSNLDDRAMALVIGVADITSPNADRKICPQKGEVLVREYNQYNQRVSYTYRVKETKYFMDYETMKSWKRNGYGSSSVKTADETYNIEGVRYDSRNDTMSLEEWNALEPVV